MKKLIGFALMATLSTSALFAAQQQPMARTNQKSEKFKLWYTCRMDTDVASDKAGKSPKCGMNLLKKEGRIPANQNELKIQIH